MDGAPLALNRMYSFARRTTRRALRVYYTQIEVHGADAMPPAGPVMVLANHHNGMVDPMLVVASSPRPVRFLARSGLFKIPLLGPLIRSMGAVEVFRSDDPGYVKSKNESVYGAVGDALAAGGVVGIFPEGHTHTNPWLEEFRHGAARMALEAQAVRALEPGIAVQLVSIHFEGTRLYGGRVLITYAPPITLESFRERYARDPRSAVEALTAALHERLRNMLVEVQDAEQLQLAELVARFGVLEQEGRGLKGQVDHRQRLLDAYQRLRVEDPVGTADVVRRLRRYQRFLDLLGLRDDHLVEDYHWARELARALGATVLLVLAAPVLVLGVLLNAVPYAAARVLTVASRSELQQSSGLLAGMLVFPLWYLLVAWFASDLGPAGLWVALVVAGPLAGWAATVWFARGRELVQATWALWATLGLPRVRARLEAMRTEILSRIERLLA